MSAARTLLGLADAYPYTGIWNHTGQPSCSVPAPSLSDKGLPLGVQLVGRPDSEETLLSLAAQLEAERPWAGPPRRPSLVAAAVREVRLHDTLSGELRPLEPREPPRVGIYACGPTVYARVHVGQRAAVRGLRAPAALPRARGLRAHAGRERHRRERQDLRRRPRAGRLERGAGAGDDRRLRGGHRPPRPRAARRRAQGQRDDRRDRGADRGPGRVRPRLRGGRRRVLQRRRASPATASSRTARSTRCSRARATTPRRSSARPQDFALWKATKEGEDTSWRRPGARAAPAGTSSARPWRRRSSAWTSRSTAGAPTSSSRTTRTRSPRPRRPAASRSPGVWMHNGMVELGTEKMAKSVGNIRLLHGALDEYGPEAVLMWLAGGHYRQPLGFSEEALEQAAADVRTLRDLVRRLDPDGPPGGPRRAAERFFDALADDFNTPAARAVLFDWVARGQPPPRRGRGGSAPGACARCCTRSAWSALVDDAAARRPRRCASWPQRARGGPRGARLRAGRPPPRRARGERLGGPRHARTAPGSSARRVIVYGRNPVREALAARAG